jgi:cysteine desulfurase
MLRHPSPAIYLDANATVQPLPGVITTVLAVMASGPVNPSSSHESGGRARKLVEGARDKVCKMISGILPEGIIFTSGATEGNNTFIASAPSGSTLITTAVEHPSILKPAAVPGLGRRLIILPVSSNGTVDPDAAAAAAEASEGPLYVSVQLANGETGVIQPLREISTAVRRMRPDALIHSDMSQAVGRMFIDADLLGVDVLTLSGHKLHGPQGTGVLAFTDPDQTRIRPLLHGGSQENGRRAGTPAVAAIAGLGEAAAIRAAGLEEAVALMAFLRDFFEETLLQLIPAARITADGSSRVPNTSNIIFPGTDGMSLAARLDAAGIACSLGSACSSGLPSPSPVLTAMGFPAETAFSALRFSFSVLNTQAEILQAATSVSIAVAGAKR